MHSENNACLLRAEFTRKRTLGWNAAEKEPMSGVRDASGKRLSLSDHEIRPAHDIPYAVIGWRAEDAFSQSSCASLIHLSLVDRWAGASRQQAVKTSRCRWTLPILSEPPTSPSAAGVRSFPCSSSVLLGESNTILEHLEAAE